MNDTVDLSGGFDKLLDAVDAVPAAEQVLDLLMVVGVVLVVIAICKFLWDKRRGGGGGGGSNVITGAIVVGALFCAPTILIPLLLAIVDVVINVLIKVWEGTGPA